MITKIFHNSIFTFALSTMLAAMTLTSCTQNDDNPAADYTDTPAVEDLLKDMEKVTANAYISDVTNEHIREAMQRRFTNQTSLDEAEIAVVTPQEIGTYDGKLLELYNRGGLVVILKPDKEEYKKFVESHDMHYAMPDAEDSEMLLFAFNKDLQYYTVFAKEDSEDVTVTVTGHDDDGNEVAEDQYVETPEVTIDAAWYVEQTNLFAKWVNELLASKARTRGSDGYSAEAVLSKTVSSGQFKSWSLSTRGYKDSEKISAEAKISYKVSVTPLHVYNYPGETSQSGDYYAIKAELTAHNRDIYKFTRFDRSGIKADDYILGFFMEHLKATFDFGKENKVVKSAEFYENPKPETSQGSVTYSSSQTMGFNMALNGGVAGGSMTLGGSGGFNASWTEGVSMNVNDLTVRTNFEPTGKVEYDYTINNIKEGYPHKGVSYYNENVNGIFRSGQKAYLPEIAINGLTMTATWIWHDIDIADNSTAGRKMRMMVTPKYGAWDWRYHSGDHRRAFSPGTKEVWLCLPIPDRTRFGVLAIKNGHEGVQMAHIKVYKQDDDTGIPVAEIPSSYGKGETARTKLNEGTYRVTFDLMSGTTVQQSLQIENITIKGAFTESAATTEVATNDGK